MDDLVRVVYHHGRRSVFLEQTEMQLAEKRFAARISGLRKMIPGRGARITRADVRQRR